MISKHGEEVRNAIRSLNVVEHRELSLDEVRHCIGNMLEYFVGTRKYQYPIWEHVRNWIGIDYRFAWEWFSMILKDKQIILLLEPADDECGFFFKNSSDLVDVLNNCYSFNFYVTDNLGTFLFCYNDHDNLIACGEAKLWLEEYLRKNDINTKVFSSKHR